MPNMSVAADYTNAAVAAAQNPSNAGYHHGEHILTISQAYAENIQAPFRTTTLVGLPLVKPQLLLQVVVVSCAYAELISRC
jgi:hypothetical protein